MQKYIAVPANQFTLPQTNLKERSHSDRFWIALSLAIFSVGFGLPSGDGSWVRVVEALKVFLIFTGGIMSFLISFEYITAIRQAEAWHRAHVSAFRQANDLPLPAYEIVPVQTDATTGDAPPEELPAETFAKVAGQQTVMPIDEAKKPPLLFIRFLYSSEGHRISHPSAHISRRVPHGEDRLEATTEFKQAGEWLRTLAEYGWINGRDREKHLPGYLVGTYDECASAFYPTVAATLP